MSLSAAFAARNIIARLFPKVKRAPPVNCTLECYVKRGTNTTKVAKSISYRFKCVSEHTSRLVLGGSLGWRARRTRSLDSARASEGRGIESLSGRRATKLSEEHFFSGSFRSIRAARGTNRIHRLIFDYFTINW